MPVLLQEIEEDHHHAEEVVRPSWWWKSHTKFGIRKLFCISLKCIVMAFMFFVFLFLVGIAAIVLIFIVTTTTSGRRRRHDRRRLQQDSSQLLTDSTPRSYSREDLQQLLPRLSYVESPHTSKECAICLENLGNGDIIRKLPDCKHLFHVNCIDNWLTKVPNCPICRTQVQLDSAASGSFDRDDEWKVWLPVSTEGGDNLSTERDNVSTEGDDVSI